MLGEDSNSILFFSSMESQALQQKFTGPPKHLGSRVGIKLLFI